LVSSTLLDAILTPALFFAFGRKSLERLAAPHPGGLVPSETY
jgi:heavy-metal exporter, HME family